MHTRGLLLAAALPLLAATACATDDPPANLPEDASSTGAEPTEGSTQSSTEASSEDSAEDATTTDDETGAASTGSDTQTTGDDVSLPADFELELTDAWACGDLLLYLANPERTLMLTLGWPGLLSNAEATGGEVIWEIDFGLPSDQPITLVVQTGTHLDANTCAGEGEEPATVDHTWNADGGTARLTVSPSALAPAGAAGVVSALLFELEVVDADDSTASIELLEVLDVPIDG